MTGCARGQSYPRWFLDPLSVGCNASAAGCVTPYFHQTASDSAAFFEACVNLARQHESRMSGGESYWETEAGVYWVEDSFSESIDSTFLHGLQKTATKLDEFSSKDVDIVLASAAGCSIDDSLKAVVGCPINPPEWVESIPDGKGFIYALGVAPKFFYETSSWESAEKKARFNLARSIRVSTNALQKVDQSSGQEMRSEVVSVVMSGFEVVHRWRDERQGLFYVLMRARSSS